MPGRFITLEGGEGAGKSTQVARLAERLTAAGLEVVTTREPGGTPKAEAFRTLLLSGAVAPLGPAAEAVMFAAARIDHLDRRIRPALRDGKWVVSDRFSDSTRAYQGVAGHVDRTLIAGLECVAVGSTRPDLTVMLDLPDTLGLHRARLRRGGSGSADRFEQQESSFHARLREGFLAIAAAEPQRCAVVDATGSVEEVAAAIWAIVERRFFAATEGATAAESGR